MTAFDSAFKYTVGNEGSYSNDKYDSGGPTKFGITQHDLSRWIHRPASVQEVKDMTLETARDIYKAWYWDTLSLDQVSSTAVAMCMFDIGVVRGIGVPPKYAQQICNNHGAALAVDGHIGPKTLLAINHTDTKQFVTEFAAKTRAGFYAIVASRPSQVVFIKGWIRRANRLLTLV